MDLDKETRPRRRRDVSVLPGLLALVALIGGPILAGVFAVPIRTTVVSAACRITACSGAGMVTAGWLVIALPLLILITGLLLGRRAGRIGQAALIVAGILAGLVALVFVPGRGSSFASIMRGAGAGADQMATGIRWGLLGLLAAGMLAVAALMMAQRLRGPVRVATATAAALALVATLGVAWVRATPTYLTAADVFPEASFTIGGNTLTRQSSADRRGCAGVLPDDGPLERAPCIRTLHVTFTTDDSDALVNFRAVLYPSNDDARAVREALPDGLAPADAHGDVRTVFSVGGTWLLIGAVGHADGRPIQAADRGWLLWALKCVTYRFLGVQSGIGVEPTPENGIGPRRP
ncbi:hypothetical protein [Polymorphospora rubra]|uniref:Uncharacterized protein n=1 Tax=Polymorphospora rubra TaxID=338584 RepID=A0A810MPW2_9ACTN|nr:hypothetical protein [Polymorphospora rubra]BCJ63121.1 hypothetical protein Prubr_01420 [Polymorphospora rubra]